MSRPPSSRPVPRRRSAASGVGGLVAVLVLAAPAVAAQEPAGGPPGPDRAWSLAAVGDVIMTRRLSQFDHPADPGFHQMAEVLRGADAAFANLELSLFRLEDFEGYPAAEYGGNWELGPPGVAADLKSMGFDLLSRANNHTTDLGVRGMQETNDLLNELGIVHAGSGRNLGWASRPGYLDTSKGRVALVALATSFTPMSRAGAARGPYMGRPGLNALRVEYTYELDPETFATMREAAREAGETVPDDAESIRAFGSRFQLGESNRVVASLNEEDRERILNEIRNARDQADHVVVTSHSHEPGNQSVTPPPWMEEWTRACIDAGATTYIIHGPHQLRGIEIYRNRPIFYSLGNFIFQNETIDPMPADNYENYPELGEDALSSDLYDARFAVDEHGHPTRGFPTDPIWYESVIAVTHFEGDEAAEIRLYPVDLGHEAPRSQRGTPRLASEAVGQKILQNVARLSEPFGTRVEIVDGTGVIRLGR